MSVRFFSASLANGSIFALISSSFTLRVASAFAFSRLFASTALSNSSSISIIGHLSFVISYPVCEPGQLANSCRWQCQSHVPTHQVGQWKDHVSRQWPAHARRQHALLLPSLDLIPPAAIVLLRRWSSPLDRR